MSAVTAADWRAAMGRFPSGVTIVTSWADDAPVGTTVNAFCSVSLEPPLLLVCLVHANPALAPIERTGLMGVNMLPAEACELARLFGRESDEERFAGVSFTARQGGAPQLAAACVFIDCVLEQAHDAGDHRILVARGVSIEHVSAAAPLLYHRGAFPSPSDPAAWE
ncbi:MAG TPA: flavin reductase family protein [Caulobacteraceae bacterium]|jgi:flavin reductase (DIM6/NTAB) family NADH-FMN oxidoreductase RutF|nr:flavin reductase family protein [Caulobacteraceae bacterium]